MENRSTTAGLNVAVFLTMLGVGMIMAILPQRIITLTGSARAVAWITAAFAVPYILLQVPIGRLSDRMGFKVFIVAGYALCIAVGGLYFFADTPALVFLGRALQGAGEAPIWALAPALLSVMYPRDKGKAIGTYNASMHVGLMLGPVLGIALARALPGSYPFLFYSVTCLLGAITALIAVRDPAGDRGKTVERFSLESAAALGRQPAVIVALLGIALYGAGYGAFLTAVPADLITLRSFGPPTVGVYFTVFYLAICASQLLTGPLVDRRGTTLFMVLGLCVFAAGLLLFRSLPLPALIVTLGVASLGLGVFYLSSMAFLNGTVPAGQKGAISGSYYLFWGLGYFLGPMLLSRLNASGRPTGYYAFAGVHRADGSGRPPQAIVTCGQAPGSLGSLDSPSRSRPRVSSATVRAPRPR